jgi:DNA-binding SARP family transcriptional activator
MEIALVGRFRFVVDGSTVALPSKGIELVSFLALQSEKRATSDRLSGVLWPDFPHERALGNLNTTLWRIRTAVRRLGGSWLLVRSGNTIALEDKELYVDLWQLEDWIKEFSHFRDCPSAIQVVSACKGELLEGAVDSEWLSVERERVRQIQLQVLRLCARHEAMNGRPSEAVHGLERALQLDPLNEAIGRELMQRYYADGRRAEALRVADLIRRRLKAELQIEPETETTKLHEAIKGSKPIPEYALGDHEPRATHLASKIHLVGRENQLAQLEEAFSEALGGGAVCVGIEGEIGIGKSRLVAEFCKRTGSRGSKVLYARCVQVSQAHPYSLVKELSLEVPGSLFAPAGFDEGSPSLASLEYHHGAVGRFGLEREAKEKILGSVASSLQTEARGRPLVLVVEDVQFADSASLNLVLSLCKHFENLAFFCILTWRSEDCPGAVKSALKSPGGVRNSLRLLRLDRFGVGLLCKEFFKTDYLSERIVDIVYRESEGNPLFAIECMKSLLVNGRTGQNGNGQVPITASHDVSPGRPASDTIRNHVVGRLNRLPKNVRQLLQLASACGREIEPNLLARTSGLSLRGTLKQLDLLIEAGFVVATGGRFEFVHDKIRELCYEEIPSRGRVRLHQRILNTLESEYSNRLDALAFHSDLARSGRATVYWERLGDRAASLWAYSEASQAYGAALIALDRLGSADQSHDLRFSLLRKRALTWEHRGELDKSEADTKRMLEIASDVDDERKRCEVLLLESRLLLRRGAFKRSLERAQLATGSARRLTDLQLEVGAREVAGMAMLRLRDFAHAEEEVLQAIGILTELKDVAGMERVWNNLGRVHLARGRFVRALDCARTAEGYSTGDANEAAMRALVRGIATGCLAKRTETLSDLRLAVIQFGKAGNSSGRAIASAWLSLFSVAAGDFVSGVLFARRGLPFKAGRGDVRWRIVAASTLSSGLWRVLGNYARAKAVIAKTLEASNTQSNPGLFLETAAAIALQSGDVKSALSLAEKAAEHVASLEWDDPSRGEILVTLVEVYLVVGRPKEALEWLQQALTSLEAASDFFYVPLALSLLAIAQRDLGLLKAAFDSSQRAMEILSQNGDFAFGALDVYWNRFLILRDIGDPGSAATLEKAHQLVTARAAQLGRVARARFMRVPVNRQIVETWVKLFGGGVSLRSFGDADGNGDHSGAMKKLALLIPRTGTPWGRRLRQYDFVEVILTVDAGKQDQALRELKGDLGVRRSRILRLCAEAYVQGGDPREEDLARVLGVTTRTIRSDIAYLRSQGCHVQTRGSILH